MKNRLKRKWKVYLLHHTHLDIGYTHTQDEVLYRQFKHLEDAMNLIEKHKNRPNNERFKWNPEITWALDEWVKIASPKQIKRFTHYVQEGYIGLDGLYGNLLTGLCRPEELMESFSSKKELEELTNTKIDSVMITDIPGWNWGFVTTLSENGIKYLSAGPNRSDRIGHILKEYADKPFYWVSPSGEEKVLTWVHGKGYSWFHTGMFNEKNLSRKLNPRRIHRYLRHLEKTGYPYDTVIIRYNIGADNGPPDHNLSSIVSEWNKEYPYMKLHISTTSEAFSQFEKEYKEIIPELKGDITPYWEDGAASTSRETSIAREAGERLIQASILSSLTNKNLDEEILSNAWRNTLLFNEHTWGAYNSISKPNNPFVHSQWSWKKDRAYESNDQSRNLISQALDSNVLSTIGYINHLHNKGVLKEDEEVTVYNTHSWNVTQIVKVNTSRNIVTDDNNNIIPSQRLNNGLLAFVASDIPGTGSRTYRFRSGESQISGRKSNKSMLENKWLKVKVNQSNGTICSITYKGVELVKQSELEQFNEYIFATTKWGTFKKRHKPKKVNVRIIDDGPVLSTLQIITDAYRTNKIITKITINHFNEHLYLENIVDRPVSRRKEGIHFAFPFNIKNGRVKYDTIYGSCVVDEEQLKGSNKNFITATRWFDVSNDDIGISCVLIDAPMFKSGPLVHDPVRSGNPNLCGWLNKTSYNGTIYSYVMNNYWMTNYKADQPGETLFRYVFLPHNKYSEAATHKFALEELQPLIVTNSKVIKNDRLLKLTNDNIVVTSIRRKDNQLFVRLFNTSLQKETTEMNIDNMRSIRVLSPMKTAKVNEKTVDLEGKETIYLKIQL